MTMVRRILPNLFLAPTTTKRRKHSNPPKLTTHPIQSHLSTPREVRKETLKLREKAFIFMFCGGTGHLDEFRFRHKRMEKMRFDYARNLYYDEFIGFPPHTSSRASSHFFHGSNHCSYGFGSQENIFVPRCFGYGPRSDRGDHPPRRHDFPDGGSYTHFEL
jgi:hypothetical protein